MAARLVSESTVMVLGGAGLVGSAIVRRLALLKSSWRPRRIVVASLTEEQSRSTCQRLEEECAHIFTKKNAKGTAFIPEWGDIFVRSEMAHISRSIRLQEERYRAQLLSDLYDDDKFNDTYENNYLVELLRKYKPQVLVDSVNTATGLSYQNTFDAALKVTQALKNSELPQEGGEEEEGEASLNETVERMLLSQSVPALVRHIQILSKVAEEQELEHYIKIGTTGTGGMGLNLPFTHSESKPSKLILAKNEAAFGHSGLLYLWGQTPPGKSTACTVQEIKPGAAIGYRNLGVHNVSDRYGNRNIRQPKCVQLSAGSSLNVREDESNYPELASMKAAAVDLGENGLMFADEFRILTAPGSMEMISPEEIAEVCVQEMLGMGTGHNVLAAIRGAVLAPGYRAGVLRNDAGDRLRKLEEYHTTDDDDSSPTMPSIALGHLGPPQLSKLLFEAQILKLEFGDSRGLRALAECDPNDISRKLSQRCRAVMTQQPPNDFLPVSLSSVIHIAPTIGVPVLLDDNTLLRGPNITVPEPRGNNAIFPMDDTSALERYVQTGWVDLRPVNIQAWKDRAHHILSEPPIREDDSTVLTGLHYSTASGTDNRKLDPAALAAWILAGEVHGHRDLNSVHCPLDED